MKFWVPLTLIVAVSFTGCAGPFPLAAVPNEMHPPAAAQPMTTNEVDHQIQGWYRAGGLALLQAIARDTGPFGDALRLKDYTQLREECSGLQQDLTTAKQFQSIPDQITQNNWSAALDSYSKGASECISAVEVEGLDTDTFEQADQDMSNGNSNMNAMTARIAAFNNGTAIPEP